MIKRIIISLILSLAVTATYAQQVRTPSLSAPEHYAAIEKFDLTKNLPNLNLHEYPAITSEDKSVTTAKEMIEQARTFLGVRYRHGGMSPKGFDCSGFTSYMFSQFGYSLKRSSADQYKSDGEKVDPMQVQPGDLIFFAGRKAGSTRVGHVGIVIDGDPVTGEITFIHSACGGGITISSSTEAYYAKRFIGVKRVIK